MNSVCCVCCLGTGQSQRKRPARIRTRIGCWNIKTLTGKEVELTEEMDKYKLHILGISEVRKKGQGIKTLDRGYTLRYSGVE